MLEGASIAVWVNFIDFRFREAKRKRRKGFVETLADSISGLCLENSIGHRSCSGKPTDQTARRDVRGDSRTSLGSLLSARDRSYEDKK